MAYHLDLIASVKAFFLPLDAMTISFHMFVIVCILASFFFKYRNATLKRRILVHVALYGMVIIISIFPAFTRTGVGWSLDDDTLTINVPPANTMVNLSDCRINLVDASGDWRTSMRVNGTSIPGLSYGRFKLSNGENAIYFRHLNNDKMLLLSSDNDFYIIEHPNVEELYAELINIGVMPGNL